MEADRPLTVGEIARLVCVAHPHVSLDTIYRNLAMFAAYGLVHQINLQNRESTRFEFQEEGGHHHHVVCLGCGKSFCVHTCPLPLVNVKPADDPSFRVLGHAFEVYGYCTSCQN